MTIPRPPLSSERLDLAGDFAVETPEQVAFRLERAGLGSRVLAAVVDGAILLVIYLVLLIVGGALGVFGFRTGGEDAALWIAAALIAAVTFVFWTYYIAYEWLWNGQTPGKRLVGIRVVDDSGTPVRFGQVVTRNLLRFVDVQLAYGVGMVAVFVTRDEKRLGDLAAGTVVVTERPPPAGQVPLPSASPTAAGRRLDPELLALLRDWVVRSGELDRRTRHGLARDLAVRVADALGRPHPAPGLEERALGEMARELFESGPATDRR